VRVCGHTGGPTGELSGCRLALRAAHPKVGLSETGIQPKASSPFRQTAALYGLPSYRRSPHPRLRYNRPSPPRSRKPQSLRATSESWQSPATSPACLFPSQVYCSRFVFPYPICLRSRFRPSKITDSGEDRAVAPARHERKTRTVCYCPRVMQVVRSSDKGGNNHLRSGSLRKSIVGLVRLVA